MHYLIQAFLLKLNNYKDFLKFKCIDNKNNTYYVDIYDIPSDLDIELCNATIEVPYTDEEIEVINRNKYLKRVENYQSNNIKVAIPLIVEDKRLIRFKLEPETYAKVILRIDYILWHYMEKNIMPQIY